ncbi:MAG: IS200/IS605 family transposase [Chloroflexota bacterium]
MNWYILLGLDRDIGSYVKQEIYRLCNQKADVEVLEANVQADHVHLVLVIPPKYAVSQLMGYVKGKLALRVLSRYPQLRKRYWGNHLWSRGYCVTTIGLDEEKIRKYVTWQEKKERETESHQKRLFD